jgi:predicted transcriptional regulator
MKQLKSRWPAVSVRVPPELHARIEAEAEVRVLPVGEIVRERLARAYDREPSSVAALTRAATCSR